LERLRESDKDPELLPFAEALWASFGLEVETLRGQDKLLKIGSFYSGELPLREEGIRFTTNRARALEREDMDLLTWDHPLLRDGIEALLSKPLGTCCCVHGENMEGPALQTLFILETIAPEHLQVRRFLPPMPILLTLDAKGTVVEKDIRVTGPADADKLLANPAFRSVWLPTRIETAERKVRHACRKIRDAAMAEADRLLSAEAQRLRNLREINDHVREAEIDALETQRKEVLEAISLSRPRLDAIRLILP
jgi:ATP-dependent helicase HepA